MKPQSRPGKAHRHLISLWRNLLSQNPALDKRMDWLVWIVGSLSFLPFLYLAWVYAIERLDWHDSACMIELSVIPGKFAFPHNRYFNALVEFPAIVAHKLGASPLLRIRIYSMTVVILHWVFFTIAWYFLQRRKWALIIPLLYASQYDIFYFAMSENPLTSTCFLLSALLLYEGILDKSIYKYVAALLVITVSLFFTHPQAGQLFLGASVIMAVLFLLERKWSALLNIGIAILIVGLLAYLKLAFFGSDHEQNKVKMGLNFLSYLSKPSLNSVLIGILYHYAPHKILYLLTVLIPILMNAFYSNVSRNLLILLTAAGVFYVQSVFLSQTGAYGIPTLEIYLYGQIGLLLFTGYILLQEYRRSILYKPIGLLFYLTSMILGWMDVYQNRHSYVFKTRFVERLSRGIPPAVNSCRRIYIFNGYWSPPYKYAWDNSTYKHIFWNRFVFSNRMTRFSLAYGTFGSGGYIQWIIQDNTILKEKPHIRYADFGRYSEMDSLSFCSITHLQSEEDILAVEKGSVTLHPQKEGYTLPARALYTVAEVSVMHKLAAKLASVPDIHNRRGFTIGYKLYDSHRIPVEEQTYTTWIEKDLLSGEATGVFIPRPADFKDGWIQFGFVMMDGRFIPSGEPVPFRVEWSLYDYLREWILGYPFCWSLQF